MKKKALFISLVLALVLTTIMPASALATQKAPFVAIGMVNAITPGNVLPDGMSGGAQAIDRQLSGKLICGNINGDFTITYKANFDLETQGGNFHGIMNVGSYVFKVNGKIKPQESEQVGPYSMTKLILDGNWTFAEGAQGQGKFHGWTVFIPTTETDLATAGYVEQSLYSFFSMSGDWQQ